MDKKDKKATRRQAINRMLPPKVSKVSKWTLAKRMAPLSWWEVKMYTTLMMVGVLVVTGFMFVQIGATSLMNVAKDMNEHCAGWNGTIPFKLPNAKIGRCVGILVTNQVILPTTIHSFATAMSTMVVQPRQMWVGFFVYASFTSWIFMFTHWTVDSKVLRKVFLMLLMAIRVLFPLIFCIFLVVRGKCVVMDVCPP